jgi:hypothetical protein
MTLSHASPSETIPALLATIKELQTLQQPLIEALRRIHEDMDNAHKGGDEWAMEWVGDVWNNLPLAVRAVSGDQDAAQELATTVRDAARQASGQQPDSAPCVCDDRPEECAAVGQPDPTTADDPVQLRWGLGDVLHSDDDTVIVCLSGPNREPYWLELDPERAAALRDDLTNPHAPAAGLSDTQPANDLRNVIARAIHRYDNHHALSGNDIPSAHHYGEADAVLAALGKTTTWTVEEDETR